jgi:hypothetical protein
MFKTAHALLRPFLRNPEPGLRKKALKAHRAKIIEIFCKKM